MSTITSQSRKMSPVFKGTIKKKCEVKYMDVKNIYAGGKMVNKIYKTNI